MNNTQRRTFSLLGALGVATASLGWGVAAYAANIINIVGNPNYDYSCMVGNDNGGSRLCRTDNATWTYYMDSSGTYALESGDRQDVTFIMNYRYNDLTDLSVSYDSSPTFSGTAETDLIWQEGAIGASAQGVTWCNNAPGGYVCDQHYVRIRGNDIYSQKLTCHEAGHAVGLLHGANSYPQTSNTNPVLECMKTPVDTNVLGSNQINRINEAY